MKKKYIKNKIRKKKKEGGENGLRKYKRVSE